MGTKDNKMNLINGSITIIIELGVKSAVDSYKFTARVKGRLDNHIKGSRLYQGKIPTDI